MVSRAWQHGHPTMMGLAAFLAMAVFYANWRRKVSQCDPAARAEAVLETHSALKTDAQSPQALRLQAGAGFSPLANPGSGRGSGRRVSCGSFAGTGGAGGGGGGFL